LRQLLGRKLFQGRDIGQIDLDWAGGGVDMDCQRWAGGFGCLFLFPGITHGRFYGPQIGSIKARQDFQGGKSGAFSWCSLSYGNGIIADLPALSWGKVEPAEGPLVQAQLATVSVFISR